MAWFAVPCFHGALVIWFCAWGSVSVHWHVRFSFINFIFPGSKMETFEGSPYGSIETYDDSA